MADYTALATVKTYGSITDTTKDSKINQIIPQVTKLIDQYTGRFFDNRTKDIKTHPWDLRPTDTIYLPFSPIIALTLVKDTGTTLVADTDYFAIPGTAVLRKPNSGRWGQTHFSVQVAGTFGYAAVPKDIEQAANEWVLVLALEKYKTYTTEEGVSASVNLTSLPDQVKTMLDFYRLRNVRPSEWRNT